MEQQLSFYKMGFYGKYILVDCRLSFYRLLYVSDDNILRSSVCLSDSERKYHQIHEISEYSDSGRILHKLNTVDMDTEF